MTSDRYTDEYAPRRLAPGRLAPGRLIVIDWGTTRLRARVFDRSADHDSADGQRAPVVVSEPWGIASVTDGDFAAVFHRVLAALGSDAADPAIPVLMSGMIGSRQGWLEAPYLACPAPIADLANHLTRLPDSFVPGGRDVRIVPGMCVPGDSPEAGMPDVMRGEETQIVGALGGDINGSGLFVLPGTHSKWALVESGRLESFMTFMSGEVFAAMRDHSLLGRTMTRRVGTGTPASSGAGPDDPGFSEGVAAGLDEDPVSGGLLHRLFGVRTRGLFDRLAGSEQEAFLSGLIIGSEVREASVALAALAAESGRDLPGDVTVLGDGPLVALYHSALEARGENRPRTDRSPSARFPAGSPSLSSWSVTSWSHDSAFAGLRRIAEAAGLFPRNDRV